MARSDSPTLVKVFEQALQREDAEARRRFLDGACAGHPEVRDRVEALLAAHELANEVLPQAEAALLSPVSEGIGTTIGRYELLQPIGEGGFGVVYMAEQKRPVRRRVALKIIKLGMDTRQVIARFEAERQALAMMDHPNIARVLDAGATDTGRPYFVMELVNGEPITTYCDRKNLSVEDRIDLFGRVCHAVQHAHQKGIIHRDIKPSNVMVTLHDGRPVPKVIDFGIAKATSVRLTEKTLFTEHRQLIGTPEYMSPEQADTSGDDMDTRSDVYSLGVLLYELLTGATPFDSATLRSAGYAEIQRIIREETPPKPSTRLSTLDTLPAVAASRHTEPKRLGTLVRGDLDWIVMKAMEKDRARRYATASGLAAELQRYLDHEPVVAGPPSAAYKLRKFVRRNRAGVGTAGVAVAAVLFGLVLAGVGFVQARAEGRRANAANVALQSQLWESRLAQARATRRGKRPGRRFDSLAAIAEAASINPSLELRDEAIASFTLDDIRFERSWSDRPLATAKGLRVVDRFAYVPAPGDVRIAAADDGRELARLAGPALASNPGPFSVSGRYIAVRFGLDADQILTVFDTRTGSPILEFEADEFIFDLIAFGVTDGREWVVVGRRPGTLTVYELPSGAERYSVPFTGSWGSAAVDFAGERIAVTNTRDLIILDAGTGEVLVTYQPVFQIWRLDFSADGRFLAGSGEDVRILVWNADDMSYHTDLQGHLTPVTSIDFASEGPYLASSGWDGTARIWNVESASLVVDPLEGWKLTAFGRRFVGAGLDRIGFWSIEPAREVVDIRSRSQFGAWAGVAIDPREELIATVGDDGVFVWDIRTGQRRLALSDAKASSVVFVESGARLVAALEHGLYAWDLGRGGGGVEAGPPQLLRAEPGGKHLFLCADGSTLAMSSSTALYLVCQQDGSIVGTLESYPGMTTTPSVTPDGRYVFTGSWQGEPGRAREVATGRVMVQRDGAHVVGTFSPDGTMLVIGTGAEYVCYATDDWTVRWTFPRNNPDQRAGVIGFSEDSTLLAVSKSRYRLELLDPVTGQALASLGSPGHQRIAGVAVSSDADLLAVITLEDRLRVFDLARIRTQLDELGLDW